MEFEEYLKQNRDVEWIFYFIKGIQVGLDKDEITHKLFECVNKEIRIIASKR